MALDHKRLRTQEQKLLKDELASGKSGQDARNSAAKKSYDAEKMREARAKSASAPKKDSTVKPAKSALKGRMAKAVESAKATASEAKDLYKKATAPATENERKTREARQRSKGSASHKTASVPQTRNEPTNARGGNKPVSKDANVKSTERYLKRIKQARNKDAAERAIKQAAKAGLGKMAVKGALKAVPVVGTAMLVKDAYDAVVADGKRTSKGGQMQRSKKSVAKKTSEGPKASTVKNRTDKSKNQKKPSK